MMSLVRDLPGVRNPGVESYFCTLTPPLHKLITLPLFIFLAYCPCKTCSRRRAPESGSLWRWGTRDPHAYSCVENSLALVFFLSSYGLCHQEEPSLYCHLLSSAFFLPPMETSYKQKFQDVCSCDVVNALSIEINYSVNNTVLSRPRTVMIHTERCSERQSTV